MIEFLWTTTNEWESRLIKWGLNEDCSHFAIRFGDIVFQSYEGRVREDTWWDFQKGKIIVHKAAPRVVLDSTSKMLHKKLRDSIGSSAYDFKAILYWGWRGLLKKIFGIPLPLKNRWGTSKNYYCVEIIDPIREELKKEFSIEWDIESEMLSPHMFFELIKDNKNLKVK